MGRFHSIKSFYFFCWASSFVLYSTKKVKEIVFEELWQTSKTFKEIWIPQYFNVFIFLLMDASFVFVARIAT